MIHTFHSSSPVAILGPATNSLVMQVLVSSGSLYKLGLKAGAMGQGAGGRLISNKDPTNIPNVKTEIMRSHVENNSMMSNSNIPMPTLTYSISLETDTS